MKWSWVIFLYYVISLLACTSNHPVYRGESDLPILKVKFSSESLTRLQGMRANAIQLGFISSRSKKEVEAAIEYEGKLIPAKVRLKGDWLDHIKTNKWSLRVKLAKGEAVLGARRFSLQHPRTRDYLSEWVYHQLLEQEDILSPKYTFVRVWWNDEYKGIFAFEEHFDEPLLERQGRRSGPILKYDEDGFWQLQAYRLINGIDLVPYLPDFEAADIEMFQPGSIEHDTLLREAFLAGIQRMNSYRQAVVPASQILDMEQMARWYALADIMEAYHSLRWHNLRFYYNPITTRLEPIVFDAYGTSGPYHWFSKPYLGYYNERYSKVYFPGEYIVFYLFNEPAFRKQYEHFLKEFTDEDFISTFLQRHEKELARLEKILQSEFPKYHYDQSFLTNGGERMREAVSTYQKDHASFEYVIYDPLFEECKIRDPISKIALKAILSADSQHIQLRNFFCEPIYIKATGPNKNDPKNKLNEKVTLPAFNIYQEPIIVEIPYSIGDQFVFFEVPRQDFWFRQKINSIGVSKDSILLDDSTRINNVLLVPDKDTLRIPQGNYVIQEKIFIPSSKYLVIEAGVQIDLIQGAAVLIEGGISMRGSLEQGILIRSSDNSSGGLHMLNCPGTIEMHYVHFDGISGWQGVVRQFSSAITMYETKGEIRHCQFSNIYTEDALNIVRSEMELEGLVFEHCRSDALDVDFSKVKIMKCSFNKIGGDAVDFSGSIGAVNGFRGKSIGDKCISVGEGSKITLNDIECSQMMVGLAVKDASICSGNQFYLDNCRYGFAVFTKKKTYSSASLSLEKVKLGKLSEKKYLLETGHFLVVEKDTISSTYSEREIYKLLYQVQQE